jgi:putative hydrolase of the HAD superfamily
VIAETIPPQKDSDFEVIFFDLGNTLIYFDGDWDQVRSESIEALINHLEGLVLGQTDWGKFKKELTGRFKLYYLEREIQYIENSTEHLLRSILREFGFDKISSKHIHSALRAMYSVSEAYWHPELDAIPTLEELKSEGYRLGIISNAAYSLDVQLLVKKAKIQPYFDEIIISADVGLRKPHRLIFEAALQKMTVLPSKAVMVGDALCADIQGAQDSNIANVWITRHADPVLNQPCEGFVFPDRTILSLSELPDLLRNWKHL